MEALQSLGDFPFLGTRVVAMQKRQDGLRWVYPKYLAPRARVLPGGRLGSDCSLGWDIWVGEGPVGLSLGAVRFKTAPRPPHHAGDRLGWPATGGPSVLLAWQGCAGTGCPASQESRVAG